MSSKHQPGSALFDGANPYCERKISDAVGWRLMRVFNVTHRYTRMTDPPVLHWQVHLESVDTPRTTITDHFRLEGKGLARAYSAVVAMGALHIGTIKYIEPKDLIGRKVWVQTRWKTGKAKHFRVPVRLAYYPVLENFHGEEDES